MPVISTTENTDFTVPEAGDFTFKVKTGRARLFEKNADNTYTIVVDVPFARLASGLVVLRNAKGNTIYRWQSIDGTSATVEVTQGTASGGDGWSLVNTLGQPTVARQLSVSGTTANQALTSTCRRITIRARGCPMRYEVGVGAQTASATTSHFLDQDERLDLSVPAGANIAAIAIPPWGSSTTGTGSLAITELA